MTKINELKTIMFLPNFLKNHPDVVAITTVVDNRIQELISRFDRLELLKRIEDGTLTDEEIELLLWERHVDYFDESLSINQKIELIKNAIVSHYKKGTKANLDKVLKIIFGELTLLEWFEYGGDPFHFKIVIMDNQPSDEIIAKLNRTVEEYKNCRSFFEGIMVIQSEKLIDYDIIGTNEITYETVIVSS